MPLIIFIFTCYFIVAMLEIILDADAMLLRHYAIHADATLISEAPWHIF